jgi:uncharacterized membrane protein YgaE (UPF0421/DUF939 family)
MLTALFAVISFATVVVLLLGIILAILFNFAFLLVIPAADKVVSKILDRTALIYNQLRAQTIKLLPPRIPAQLEE